MQKVASDKVTAIDDGTMPNEWGSENIDDEGTPTSRLVLIENGVLKNYMVDRFNARRMHMPVTGSGRRQGYMFAPTSRMRNTYIAAGDDDNDEIIASMGDGLYAKVMGGGSVEPATGKFNFAVNEGYLVRDGKIAHPVRGASMIGRGRYANGAGHVRLAERQRADERRPAHDSRQLHDRGRTLRKRRKGS